MQRRLSNSSNGSAATKPKLQRQGSNGSMSERTFRDNSPLRSNSQLADDPPIPSLPRNLPNKSRGGVLRPASTEPPGRVTSPVSKAPGGRGVSLDRGNVKPKNEITPPMPKPKPARIDTTVAPEQRSKRSSVNFSRPMSPTLSPPASPQTQTNGQIGKTNSQITTTDKVDAIDYPLKNRATGAMTKKKKRVAKEVMEEGHLATGNSSAKPIGAAGDAQGATKEPNGHTTEAQSTQQSDSDISSVEKPKVITTKSIRPSNKLTKQPSMVKEDVEGEVLAERGFETSNTNYNTAEPDERTSTPNTTTTAVTVAQALQAPAMNKDFKRTASLSPARTARFSSQLVSDRSGEIRHEPLPRAVSPAKSAMKHSPLSRGSSPALFNDDVPDNESVASEDGKRKRRSMRVSFEESPIIVGQAADSTPSKSPFIFSPQHKDHASRHSISPRANPQDQEQDEVISPIPTLPSFGSVRGRKDRHLDDNNKALYGDEQARNNLVEMTSSTDRVIGLIVAENATSSRLSSDPLPPEVTSVEGSGQHSDTESSDEESSTHAKTAGVPNLESSSLENSPGVPISSSTNSPQEKSIPSIAVLPATPGHEVDNQNRESWLSRIPGSFIPNDSLSKSDSIENSPTHALIDEHSDVAVPQRESIVEPEPESAQREHSPDTPAVGTIAESLRRHDDEPNGSDSGDSVYSDAAEDPVDLEGDGFGSINAIVDSPIVSPVSSNISRYTKGKEKNEDDSPSPTTRVKSQADWEVTKNYWSGVSDSKRAQLESGNVGVAISLPSNVTKNDHATRTIEQPVLPPKSAARIARMSIQQAAATRTPGNNVTIPKKSALKEYVRSSSEQLSGGNDVPPMRKSMRGPSSTSPSGSRTTTRNLMVSTLRQQSTSSPPPRNLTYPRSVPLPTSNSQKPKQPPTKALQSALVNGSANKKSTLSPKSAPAKQTPQSYPKLSRTMSNDSDSSSSFKRERRRRPQQGGAFAMKRSLREPKARPRIPAVAPDSDSIISNRPMSMTSVTLKTSMRDKTTQPQRHSSDRVASPSGSFFGRKKKVDSKPLFSRKFSDSSAEDIPTRFSSRFRDSSDEEDLTPVRGIPRRTIEEDSTDLEDSDAETRPQPAAAKKTAALPQSSSTMPKSMRLPVLPQTPVATKVAPQTPPDSKRRSFFGILGKRKEKSKIGKSGLDSAARRDTPLERTKLERNAIDNRISTPEYATPSQIPTESPLGSPSPAIRPGKLQRRNTSQRTISSSCPLPPSPPIDVPVVIRPTTSDGTPPRPAIGIRQVSNTTNVADGITVGRSGKKKRFPMLRKAFGLHD